MKVWRRFGTTLWAVILVVVVSGCGSTATGGNSPARGNVTIGLRYAFTGPLDPAISFGSPTPAQLEQAMYDRLLDALPDGQLVPYLASSWKVTPTSVTFTIRKGATCPDGTSITAKVVDASFQRYDDDGKAHPATDPAGYYLGPRPHTFSYDEAANTFTITTAPNSGLQYGFIGGSVGIVCPAGFAASADFSNQSYGSGEYILQSRTADTVVMKRRTDWSWGPQGRKASDPGVPDTLTWKVITDDTTAANALLTNEVATIAIAASDTARVKADGSLAEIPAISTVAAHLLFNEDPARVASDKAVRQALITAVDPNAWNQASLSGQGAPATSFFSPATRCYDKNTATLVPKPDVAAAKAILAADGWVAGSNGKLQKGGRPLAITLIGQQPVPDASYEYLASVWDQLGVSTTIHNEDPTTFNKDSGLGNWDVRNGTFAAYGVADPTVAPTFWDGSSVHTSASGLTRTTDSVVINDEKSGRTTLDCAPWTELQERLLTEFHMLPLAYFVVENFARGITFNPINGAQFDTTTLRRT